MAFSFLLAASSVVSAKNCTLSELKTARAEFKALYDQKLYSRARAIYEQLEHRCSYYPDDDQNKVFNAQYYWIQSDIALSEHKDGHDLECMRLLAPTTDPMAGYQRYITDNDAVGNAIDFNFTQCQKSLTQADHPEHSVTCHLPSQPTHIAGIQIPGAPNQCLLLLPARQKASEENMPAHVSIADACPQLIRYVTTGGKSTKQPMIASDGPLADIDQCCNLNQLEFLTQNGQQFLHIRSDDADHPCTGGTASLQSDALYQMGHQKLTLKQDRSIGYH